ncbi:hypothetical protein QFC24_004416 [Naganishia onofrii]|uniref:Uncharacterized protein n=1 Tax=Naganishia onofrii TaxID=1851511 RepID=A0ACC2XGM2_9TREE|nr:hypothetical protein QFC24_004416 [Naganishia onofrii]
MSALDQPQFVASNTDVPKHSAIGDIGSPMQEDAEFSVEADLEQRLAEIETPTPDELAKIGADLTERMTDFNRELYPEGYARCKELYRFARQHITDLIADMPLDPEKTWQKGLDDSAWVDDDDMEEEESKDTKNGKSDATSKPYQSSKPIKAVESSTKKE